MLQTDAGFLTVVVAAVVYCAMLVLMASQAWYGAVIATAIQDRSAELGLRMCGMYFVLLSGVQAASVLFVRMTLYGDLRSLVWGTLPISERSLRYVRWIDSLVNPGVIASLLAGWLVVFRFVQPTGWLALIACTLTAPAFVLLTQSVVLLGIELLESYRRSLWWAVPVGVAFVGAPTILYMSSMHGVSGVVDLLMGRFAGDLLAIPPWSFPMWTVRALHGAMPGIALVAPLAAAVVSGAVLFLAARVAPVEPA
jgi:hypothetical protein